MTEQDPHTRAETVLTDLGEAVHQAVDAAPAAARREMRRWWPRVLAANVVLTVSLLVGALALADMVTEQGNDITALQAAAEQAKPTGDAANAKLEQRGQPPVPIPEPGTGADIEVIVNTATARVLASIPDPRPSAADLGEAVARYLADNPPGPTPGQISAALAGYLVTNPPPSGAAGAPCDPIARPECRGPQGDPGPPGEAGRPPTAEEIQAAVGDYIRTNPDVLCPLGGSFAAVRVALATGGSADTWTCVVTEYPPPAITTTTAPPSTTTITSGLLPVPLGRR